MIANDREGHDVLCRTDADRHGATRARRVARWAAPSLLLSFSVGYIFFSSSSGVVSETDPSVKNEYKTTATGAVRAAEPSESIPRTLPSSPERAPRPAGDGKIPPLNQTLSPAAALAQAQRQPEPARTTAIVALFESIANDRATAVMLGRQLFQGDAKKIDADGTAVIGALVRAGSFDAALDLAADGPETSRAEWLNLVLPALAGRQPEAAADIALSLAKQGVEGSLFAQVLRSWADAAPADAIHFALSLPFGDARTRAFQDTLNTWLQRDPVAVAEWLPSVKEPREGDHALAAFLTRTDAAVRPTSTAFTWADHITDPVLRYNTLAHIVQEWAFQNPSEARTYLQRAAPRVSPDQRAQLVAIVNSPSKGDADSPL